MKIEDNLLTINPYSRSGKALKTVKAIVIHWLANPWQSATNCRNFFESRKDGKQGYGSAHYIIGLDGYITQCIPESEVAYHCGSSQKDPVSGKYYTDLARTKFGTYAIDYVNNSPNMATIGVEHCHIDNKGEMKQQTIEASVELSADLCKRYGLDPMSDILLHKDVVGWKSCHKWYVDNPNDWQAYKVLVKNKMEELNGKD